MKRNVWVVVLLMLLFVSACTSQVRTFRPMCEAVVMDADAGLIETAAHCVEDENGFVIASSGDSGWVGYKVVSIDRSKDTATLQSSIPILGLLHKTSRYKNPKVGSIGYFLGSCALRKSDIALVLAVDVVRLPNISRDVTFMEWLIRSGNVSCPGDSGAPIWDVSNDGEYMGIISRYGKTAIGSEAKDWGQTIYTVIRSDGE